MYKDICVAVESDRLDTAILKTASQVAKAFEADLTVAAGGPILPVPLPIAGFAAGGGIVEPRVP